MPKLPAALFTEMITTAWPAGFNLFVLTVPIWASSAERLKSADTLKFVPKHFSEAGQAAVINAAKELLSETPLK